MQLKFFVAASAILLAGCSDLEPINESVETIAEIEPDSALYADGKPVNEFGFMQASEPGILNMFEPSVGAAGVASADVAEPAPQEANAQGAGQSDSNQKIAYSYGYGFRIDSDEIKELQAAHIAMCNEMGEACRILRSSQARSDSWDGYGELKLQVAADKANDLEEALTQPAEELGGSLISNVRNGEDLTEKIIDTEARIQSRILLRDKLTEVLRTARGSVAELVQAEKALADVNEQLDAARQRLTTYQNRIQYSEVSIEYEPAFGETQVGFVRPIASALRSVGSTLGVSVAAIIYTLTALLPVALLILALRWILHRFGFRLRFWKKDLRAEKGDA